MLTRSDGSQIVAADIPDEMLRSFLNWTPDTYTITVTDGNGDTITSDLTVIAAPFYLKLLNADTTTVLPGTDGNYSISLARGATMHLTVQKFAVGSSTPISGGGNGYTLTGGNAGAYTITGDSATSHNATVTGINPGGGQTQFHSATGDASAQLSVTVTAVARKRSKAKK